MFINLYKKKKKWPVNEYEAGSKINQVSFVINLNCQGVFSVQV
jgi:hypothetical protein